MENADKFIWRKGDITPLTNDTMVCKNCMFCIMERNDICAIYQKVKPTDVIKGGKCKSFKAK